MRCLWVQGYTDSANELRYVSNAFPVGTGIYRWVTQTVLLFKCVPCGYRDIPDNTKSVTMYIKRSLWVQGYTGLFSYLDQSHFAFPVGTGIYRGAVKRSGDNMSVPCGYRDIPFFLLSASVIRLRSLWVQGYTVILFWIVSVIDAFPVGTGIYRFVLALTDDNGRVPCGYRDIPKSQNLKVHKSMRSLWVQGYTG